MSLRCRACLSTLSLAACFSDTGPGVTNPSTASDEVSAGTTAETTGETAAGTTADGPTPTSAATTTSATPDTTTDAETSAPTTSPVCDSNSACMPGAVMDTGALCDPCGRVQQTCTPDCTWGPDTCTMDYSSCVYWTFDALGNTGWQRVALPKPPPEHAPTGPVLAALDLRGDDRIVALTADRYHVLSGQGTWDASGPRSDFLPGLPGQVLQAYAVYDAEMTSYSVTIVDDPKASIFTLGLGQLAANYIGDGDCCGSFTQTVQPPSLAAVRDLFLDIDPPFAWIPADQPACDVQDYLLNRYAAWATTTTVYVQDVGSCFTMQYSQTLAQFPPFAAPGAPPADLIGGLALLDERLYVFAGE